MPDPEENQAEDTNDAADEGDETKFEDEGDEGKSEED